MKFRFHLPIGMIPVFNLNPKYLMLPIPIIGSFSTIIHDAAKYFPMMATLFQEVPECQACGVGTKIDLNSFKIASGLVKST